MARKTLLAIPLIALLLAPIVGISAQQSNWATLISIKDKTGNTQLQEDQPLLAGHTYNVTMKIEVPFTQNTSIFVLNLDENMTRSGPQYWYLLTTNYTGFEPTIYTPSENIIAFIQVEGEIKLSVLFSIPQNATIKQKGDVTFRFIKTDQKLIQVKVDGGATVGSLTHDISDSAIENYINTAEQKTNLIPNGHIDKSFEPLVTSILAKADKIYKIGLPEEATKILDAITPILFPPPPDTTLQTALTAAVILLAITTAASIIMYTRLNTRAQLNTTTIDDTRDELANLEVTAGRYDESLANQLKRLREKLSEEE